MIQEDYVSYETAKLLKEKGFDRYPLFPCYKEDNGEFIDIPTTLDTINYCFIPAPTIQMVMKWLREVHDLHIDIFVTYKDGIPHYQWSIDNLKTQDTISETPCCNAYEEACETAIRYSLKNLI